MTRATVNSTPSMFVAGFQIASIPSIKEELRTLAETCSEVSADHRREALGQWSKKSKRTAGFIFQNVTP